MQAYQGYFEDGRFVPSEQVSLPARGKAVLLFIEDTISTNQQVAEWRALMTDIRAGDEELELSDFPRFNCIRELEI
jgi:hypothetical protein